MFGKRSKGIDGIGRLRELSFFDGFTDDDLQRVAALAESVEADAGAVLMEQGRVGQDCYVIESGSAGVYVADEHVVTLGPGSIVGEMALVDHRPRSATVVIESPSRLLAFDTKAFRQLLTEMPIVEERVMAMLADRLRANRSGG